MLVAALMRAAFVLRHALRTMLSRLLASQMQRFLLQHNELLLKLLAPLLLLRFWRWA